MKVFSAIPVSPQIRGELSRLEQSPVFQKRMRPIRLEAHLTLTAPQMIPDHEVASWVDSAKSAIARNMAPEATIAITGVGFVTAYTLCLLVTSENLASLHRDLNRELARF